MSTNNTDDDRRNRVFNVITAIVAALAIVLGTHRAIHLFSGGHEPLEPELIVDWQRLGSEGHRSGPEDARVTIVVFFDFLCPFCQEAAFALHSLRQWFPSDLAVVYRHAPLISPISLNLAVAAECADIQGQFVPFFVALMATPDSMYSDNRQYWARQAPVTDTSSFLECMEKPSPSVYAAIQRDTLAARSLGIRGTPLFLVDSLLIRGYPGVDRLYDLIRESVRPEEMEAQTGNGVEVELGWEFQRMWELTTIEDDFLAASYLDASDVDTDGSGNIYVLDNRAQRVFVVSADGELLDSLGRAGSGPGEFCNPHALDVGDSGVLTVMDLCRPGFLRWRVPGGQLMDQIRTEDVLDFDAHFRVLSESDDEMIVTERESVFDDPQLEELAGWHVSRWTPTTGQERMFVGALARWHGIEMCHNYMIYPEYFQPRLKWDGRNGVMAVAEDSAYAIHIFIDGQETGRIRRNIAVRRVTRAMVERQIVADGFDSQLQRCNVSSDELIATIGYSRYVQTIADVRVGPGGELWVLQGRIADEPNVIDVFAKDGEYLGTLPLGSPFPAAFLSSDEIVVTGRDGFGATLTLFRVSRREG